MWYLALEDDAIWSRIEWKGKICIDGMTGSGANTSATGATPSAASDAPAEGLLVFKCEGVKTPFDK